jgi:hypothetical protein
MPNIYIPQVPMRRDQITHELVPAMDLSACAEFGTPIVLFPSGYMNLNTASVVHKVYEKMWGFNDEDFILPIGGPANIAIVSSIASTINDGRYMLLVWDKKIARYLKLSVDINRQPESHEDRGSARAAFLRKLQAAQNA